MVLLYSRSAESTSSIFVFCKRRGLLKVKIGGNIVKKILSFKAVMTGQLHGKSKPFEWIKQLSVISDEMLKIKTFLESHRLKLSLSTL